MLMEFLGIEELWEDKGRSREKKEDVLLIVSKEVFGGRIGLEKSFWLEFLF